MRKNDDLPYCGFFDQPLCNPIFPFVVLGGHWIIKNYSGISRIQTNFCEKVREGNSLLFALAQYRIRLMASLHGQRPHGLAFLSGGLQLDWQYAIELLGLIGQTCAIALANDFGE